MPPNSTAETADSTESNLPPAFMVNVKHGNYPAAGKTFDVGGIPLMLVPDNCSVRDMEGLLPAPVRVRAHLMVREVASFLRYLSLYSRDESMIFAALDNEGVRATAIIDYAAASDKPAWGSHRITLRTMFSKEWKRLVAHNGHRFTQETFAEFVEENIQLFDSPTGADMLAIAREIEMKTNVEWRGMKRENGDTSLSYVSTSTAKANAGAGDVDVPQVISFQVAPFQGGEQFTINARLRPRLSQEGALSLGYEMIQAEALIENATKQIIEIIANDTEIVPLIGDVPDKI